MRRRHEAGGSIRPALLVPLPKPSTVKADAMLFFRYLCRLKLWARVTIQRLAPVGVALDLVEVYYLSTYSHGSLRLLAIIKLFTVGL